jgi:hypothetical protein
MDERTPIIWPVINAAAGEKRKTVAFAQSSILPTRPAGVVVIWVGTPST